ncbi:hypothetical protein K469DRAFT_606660, partial [Zopfia rhizophila CBS 207.26]
RPVTNDDIGLKVLREPPADTPEEVAKIIDIVAIHGIGAHPDDIWCKNIGTNENDARPVNWLRDPQMLPSVVPNTRILRYGYDVQWCGYSAIRQSVNTVADRFLLALGRGRKDFPSRPLILIAHCLGGLVVLKALVEAHRDPGEWLGIFNSVKGLLFFGTPFRGAEGISQSEILEAAWREHSKDQVQDQVLQVLQPGNELLQDLVDQFGKIRGSLKKAQIACFYELKRSNIGQIVARETATVGPLLLRIHTRRLIFHLDIHSQREFWLS